MKAVRCSLLSRWVGNQPYLLRRERFYFEKFNIDFWISFDSFLICLQVLVLSALRIFLLSEDTCKKNCVFLALKWQGRTIFVVEDICNCYNIGVK